MKPDLELVRVMLLALGENEDASGRGFALLDVPGRSREEVSRHVGFLIEAGLVEAADPPGAADGCEWNPVGLTKRGRKFLASARDEDSWKRAKKKLGRKQNSFLGVLKQMLFDLITSIFGL